MKKVLAAIVGILLITSGAFGDITLRNSVTGDVTTLKSYSVIDDGTDRVIVYVPEGSSQPAPTPEPTPTPTPTPEPTPTPPPANNVNCADANIQCAYNITSSEWNSTNRPSVTTTIPPYGTTLVSRFTTGPQSKQFIRLSWTTPVGGPRRSTNVWVSESVMGPVVNNSGRCRLDRRAYNYQIRLTTYESRYCNVKPNTTYYVHHQHSEAGADQSKMIRELTTSIRD